MECGFQRCISNLKKNPHIYLKEGEYFPVRSMLSLGSCVYLHRQSKAAVETASPPHLGRTGKGSTVWRQWLRDICANCTSRVTQLRATAHGKQRTVEGFVVGGPRLINWITAMNIPCRAGSILTHWWVWRPSPVGNAWCGKTHMLKV